MTRIGIIDLGSNSSRLVIYEISDNGSYRPCYRMKKNIQLARYVDDEGRISPAGMHQAVVSIRAFRNVGRLYNVGHWIAVATAAVRQAKNGTDVLRLLEEQTSIHVRLLNGEEEAWYGYLGVINTMDVQDAILVDIGGASTEIIHVRDRVFANAVSLPYGALTLTRQFSQVEPQLQTDSIFQFMQCELSDVPWLKDLRDLPVVGIGGTARAVGKISGELHGAQVNRLHGHEVQQTDLHDIYEKMKSATVDERKKLGDLSDSRAEVIHAGVAVVWSLASMLSASRMLVSGSGLREGMFYEYLFCDRATPVLSSVKEHSIHNFMKLFDVNMEAAYRVADCADRLFDQLAPFHELRPKQKQLMRTSAFLDTAGTFLNVEKYTRHTDYLIRSSHLYGFTQDELMSVSRVILGKGAKSFKQLNLIIQLAKALVYEAGTSCEDIRLQMGKDELAITYSHQSLQDMDADFESLRKGFEKQFGIRMRRRAS